MLLTQGWNLPSLPTRHKIDANQPEILTANVGSGPMLIRSIGHLPPPKPFAHFCHGCQQDPNITTSLEVPIRLPQFVHLIHRSTFDLNRNSFSRSDRREWSRLEERDIALATQGPPQSIPPLSDLSLLLAHFLCPAKEISRGHQRSQLPELVLHGHSTESLPFRLVDCLPALSKRSGLLPCDLMLHGFGPWVECPSTSLADRETDSARHCLL